MKNYSISSDTLTVGGKSYPLSKVDGVVAHKPTLVSGGSLCIDIRGERHIVSIDFGKSDTYAWDRANKILSAVAKKNAERRAHKVQEKLQSSDVTAEYLYNHKIGGVALGSNKKLGVSMFQMVIDALRPGETIVAPFYAAIDDGPKSGGQRPCALVVTDQRIILAQRQPISFRQSCRSVALKSVDTISIEQRAFKSSVAIYAHGDVIALVLPPDSVQDVYNKLMRALEVARAAMDSKKSEPAQAVVVQQPQSPVAQVKELKELLDMGIITQDEFDKKKKELLGL